MQNKKRFSKILKDIKDIKIQGARNIAKAALYAYSLKKTREAKKQLINTRPTEPMLTSTLHNYEKLGYKKTISHFDEAQEKINNYVQKIIRNNFAVFTHCHSTNVVNALIYSKKHGKKFSVINTETRPLFQGRKTAKELEKANISVTTIIDSAAHDYIKKSDIVLFGADAILKDGIINKIGSNMFAEIAHEHKIPIYIIADSWKFSPKNVKIEERDFHEVWARMSKHIKIKNPAFEKIEKRFIKAIISELGILSPREFVKRVKRKIN